MKKTYISIIIILAVIISGCTQTENKIDGEPIYENDGMTFDSKEPLRKEPLLADIELKANVSIEGNPIIGTLKAPVTLVEFSDFQCPYCMSFYKEVLPKLKENYIDNGKVKLVFKHFPLYESHPLALPAALASECAASQGRFWDMHNKIFDEFAAWQTVEDPNTVFNTFASDLRLQTERFNTCITDEQMLEKIGKDYYEGKQNNVRVTPTFIINGNVHTGFQSYETLSQLLDEQLN